MREYTVDSADEMKKLGAMVAAGAEKGDIFLLNGTLGAGKTTFAQGFINSLQLNETHVTSPTFNIIQTYDTTKFTICHCDLYRLESVQEVINTGIEDAIDKTVMLIEWPEIMLPLLSGKYINLDFKLLDNSRRTVVITP